MWRILFLLSALIIGAALVARWFFGMRILASEGNRVCRCNLTIESPSSETSAETNQRTEDTAFEFGRKLRLQAMQEWKIRDQRASTSRENTRRFGLAVPPLSAVVATCAVLVAKIPFLGGLAAFLAATALACVLGVLSLAPELIAIQHAAKKLRQARTFPRRDDEDAVIHCAIAHAWKETLPPIVGLLQRERTPVQLK